MYPANTEPSLDELLTDPVARLLMRGDRLQPEQVRSCVAAVQKTLRAVDAIERHGADPSGVTLPQSSLAPSVHPCVCPW